MVPRKKHGPANFQTKYIYTRSIHILYIQSIYIYILYIQSIYILYIYQVQRVYIYYIYTKYIYIYILYIQSIYILHTSDESDNMCREGGVGGGVLHIQYGVYPEETPTYEGANA